MLVFDQEQMELLSVHTVARFEARLLNHLLGHFPRQLTGAAAPAEPADEAPPVDAAAALGRLRIALERGRTHGFRSFPELTDFVALALINARDSQPGEAPLLGWTRSIIEHPGAEAGDKLALIHHELAQRARSDERVAAAAAALADARKVLS